MAFFSARRSGRVRERSSESRIQTRVIVAVAGAFLVMAGTAQSGHAQIPPDSTLRFSEDWLSQVNEFRGVAGLGPVIEDPDLSRKIAAHLDWMVRNERLSHPEDPSTPGYSTDGDLAGRSSNLMAFSYLPTPNPDTSVPIVFWMALPFHAIGVLNPYLSRSGFAELRTPSAPRFRYAAGLWTVGTAQESGLLATPVVWPARNMTTYSVSFTGGETPDPLASCPGYHTPTGAYLAVLFGMTPNVTAYSVLDGDRPLTVCKVDAASDSTAGRFGSVILIPKDPLELGHTYTASVTSTGSVNTTVTWTFRTGTGRYAPPPTTAPPRPTVPTRATTTTAKRRPSATTTTTAKRRPRATTTTKASRHPPAAARTTSTLAKAAKTVCKTSKSCS